MEMSHNRQSEDPPLGSLLPLTPRCTMGDSPLIPVVAQRVSRYLVHSGNDKDMDNDLETVPHETQKRTLRRQILRGEFPQVEDDQEHHQVGRITVVALQYSVRVLDSESGLLSLL
jgi:hypothetical protein